MKAEVKEVKAAETEKKKAEKAAVAEQKKAEKEEAMAWKKAEMEAKKEEAARNREAKDLEKAMKQKAAEMKKAAKEAEQKKKEMAEMAFFVKAVKNNREVQRKAGVEFEIDTDEEVDRALQRQAKKNALLAKAKQDKKDAKKADIERILAADRAADNEIEAFLEKKEK
eukprot:9155689-Karenia_brevis.AAC.1